MNGFSTLLTVLATLLPLGSGETSDPIVLGLSAVPRAVPAREASDLIRFPADLPSPTESFFERLDEIALDEEESTGIEDDGIVRLTCLVDAMPRPNDRSYGPFPPVSPHAQPCVLTTILRC